jgi:hypothetical protein
MSVQSPEAPSRPEFDSVYDILAHFAAETDALNARAERAWFEERDAGAFRNAVEERLWLIKQSLAEALDAFGRAGVVPEEVRDFADGAGMVADALLGNIDDDPFSAQAFLMSPDCLQGAAPNDLWLLAQGYRPDQPAQ